MKILSIRLDDKVYEHIKKEAEKEARSINNIINLALKKYRGHDDRHIPTKEK